MVSPIESGESVQPIKEQPDAGNTQKMRELEWETQVIALILKLKGKAGKEKEKLKRIEQQIKEGKGSPKELQEEVNKLTHELNLPRFEFGGTKGSFDSVLETVEIYLTALAATRPPNQIEERSTIQEIADTLLKSRSKQSKDLSPKEAQQILNKHIEEINKKLPEGTSAVPMIGGK